MTVAQSENAVELADLTVRELEDELAELVSHIYAGTCRWLELVAELDRRGDWGLPGCRSCAEWIAWRCALTPRAAREHVRVARRLLALPRVRGAFARGELSYAKVRALTRVAEPGSEEELLELAGAMTAAQLERAVRAYRRVTAEEANEAHENEYLDHYWDEDGSLVIRGRLSSDEGALFLRSLEAARDSLWASRTNERGSAEPRTERGPTDAEALTTMADAALSNDGARSGGERYQVVLHVDAGALPGGESGSCVLEDGMAVAPETARRLACDAAVVPITHRAGSTLSIGRKTRTVPPALRRALQARDRGCRFPGCENRRFVDAHHVRHWAQGGETSMENLLLLCRRHHRLVHEGGVGVESRPGGGVRFRNARGQPIPCTPTAMPGDLDRLRATNPHLIDTETCRSGTGERMDLALVIEAMLEIAGGRSST